MLPDGKNTVSQAVVSTAITDSDNCSTDCIAKETEELLDFFYSSLVSSKMPNTPKMISDNPQFINTLDYVMMLRDVMSSLSRGDISPTIKHKGFLAGCIKQLQAHLRHLTWYADRLSVGDFNQQIDFMGNFSESFNTMSQQLHKALTELKEHKESLLKVNEELLVNKERWRLAVTCTQDGMWDVDLKANRAFFSLRLWEILRRPPIDDDFDFDPLMWCNFIHPNDVHNWVDLVLSLNSTTRNEIRDKNYFEIRVRGGDAKYRWIAAHYMLVSDNNGMPYRFVGACEDIQEKHERESAIRFRATHDNLTGLPNRYLYNDRLAQHIAMAKRSTELSVIMIVWDLDGFKQINDVYGHNAGDQLLRGVADVMNSCVRDTDTVARFGGDEFIILLTSPRGSERETALQTTGRIFKALNDPINIGEACVVIGASCGISFYPEHTTNGDNLFSLADKALYIAKNEGKHRAHVWSQAEA